MKKNGMKKNIEEPTVRWFGRKYPAPVYSDCPSTDAPLGSDCVYCNEAITLGDDGFIDAGDSTFHRACFLRLVLGSIAHQAGMCSCFNPEAEDATVETLTPREEAAAAVAFHEKHHQRQGEKWGPTQ